MGKAINSWIESAYSCPLFSMGNSDTKLGQTDLVFGVQSEFISKSVHTRTKVSVYSSYNVCPL